jgi:hypothetical protein
LIFGMMRSLLEIIKGKGTTVSDRALKRISPGICASPAPHSCLSR